MNLISVKATVRPAADSITKSGSIPPTQQQVMFLYSCSALRSRKSFMWYRGNVCMQGVSGELLTLHASLRNWKRLSLEKHITIHRGITIIVTNNSVALVSERPPLVGEVSAKFLRIEGFRVVSAADPHGRNLSFLFRSRYCLFLVAP
jgi:hypothetical protein